MHVQYVSSAQLPSTDAHSAGLPGGVAHPVDVLAPVDELAPVDATDAPVACVELEGPVSVDEPPPAPPLPGWMRRSSSSKQPVARSAIAVERTRT